MPKSSPPEEQLIVAWAWFMAVQSFGMSDRLWQNLTNILQNANERKRIDSLCLKGVRLESILYSWSKITALRNYYGNRTYLLITEIKDSYCTYLAFARLEQFILVKASIVWQHVALARKLHLFPNTEIFFLFLDTRGFWKFKKICTYNQKKHRKWWYSYAWFNFVLLLILQ